MNWSRKDVIAIHDLTADEIGLVLDMASSFKEISKRDIKKVPTLRGKTVVLLFYEPSTRTRLSFEIAAKRLSADTVALSASGSSFSKGETIMDAVYNVTAMAPDCIVIRYPYAGIPAKMAELLPCSVINGGDGFHEHPTQALLDMYTLREHFGRLEGLTVAIVGDDGVRYYGSHLSAVDPGVRVGDRVTAGRQLGLSGDSGNAAGIDPHLHFGISRPTTPEDWMVRRGEVNPYPYLQAWERGENLTPVLP